MITPPKPETRLTFGQLAKRFLSAKNGDYTQRTRDGIKSYLDTQLLPQFGKTPLHRITTPALADWFYRYSQTRSGGANAALIHFTTIWNWGRAEQFVPTGLPNPAKPIKKNVRAPVGRMINTADLKRLAQVLNDPPTRTREAAEAVRLILLTGCRSGEIFRLTWNEVKPDRLKLKRTKTGPRTVMLSIEAKDVLDARRRERCSDFVFPSPFDPTRPRGSIHGAWMTIKRLASLPETLRPHDLRHTYASHAILAGESLYATGKLLGHRSASSTEQYTHLEGKVLAKVADQVAGKIERWMEG